MAQLETLLLLRRESHRPWNARELAQRLYLSENMCQAMLNELERRKFLARATDGESVRYECTEPATDAMIASLEDLYRERRVAVISEIHSTPMSKVQTFADAFRLRKDGKS